MSVSHNHVKRRYVLSVYTIQNRPRIGITLRSMVQSKYYRIPERIRSLLILWN